MIHTDSRWGWLSLFEMFVFLGILILGLAYVWVKGDLDWIKPNVITPTVDSRVPASLYEKLNKQQSIYITREFTLEKSVTASQSINASATATQSETTVRKPMFKPIFKKPGNES